MPALKLLLVLMLLASAVSVHSQTRDGADSENIPVVGRPVDLPFSEASGWFEVHARAEPTTLQAETPLSFTLSVRALRPTRRPPQRLDLRQVQEFEEQFYIEDSSEDSVRPDDRTWEFAYRLKPRRANVKAIPSLPFVYFNPYLLTANKGFQVLYTDPIPLHVLPHETVPIPLQASESAFVLAKGPQLLERQTPWTPPSRGATIVLLLAPPFGCLAWYIIWHRLYPDAARLASQRRSRAALRALQALDTARRLDAEMQAQRTTALVVDYLQQRLDLLIAEPTPREVALLIARHGYSSTLTEQAVRFFEACDLARFQSRSESASLSLHDAAVRFILAVEAETEEDKETRRQGDKETNLYHFLPLYLLVSLSPCLLDSTLTERDVLERAETEFQEGVRLRQDREQARPHFRDAAGYFEELHKRGVRNADLYRNLGNAYLLAEDLPNALLSYHRGLRLSLNDRTLRDSLNEARQRVVYPPSGDLGRPHSDDRPPWLPYLPSGWLMFAAISCYLVGCVSLTRWRMVRRGNWLIAGLITLLFSGMLAVWCIARVEELREYDVHPLMVIARDGVLLRRGNGEVFPPRFDTPVNRGVEGRFLFERGNWVQIELSGGEIGWVPRGAVLVDAP